MATHLPVREIIFGLEDSLVSTLGVVVGIAAGTESKYLVILSALIIIVVESLSMSAGAYLSNKSEMEMNHQPVDGIIKQSLIESLFMGISYILGGFISVLPFFFITPEKAIIPAIIFTVLTLFVIGFIKGSFAGTNKIRSGIEMSLVSLSAAVLGYFVGKYASIYIGHN